MTSPILTFNDVSSHADVDQEELWQFISGDVPLGQHPSTQDEDEEKELLN